MIGVPGTGAVQMSDGILTQPEHRGGKQCRFPPDALAMISRSGVYWIGPKCSGRSDARRIELPCRTRNCGHGEVSLFVSGSANRLWMHETRSRAPPSRPLKQREKIEF